MRLQARLALCAATLLAVAAASPDAAPDRFRADELVYSAALDPATQQELQPIHDMDGMIAAFQRHHIPFVRRTVTLPTDVFPANVWQQIDVLPPGEPLVVPQGPDRGVVLVIVERHVADDA